MKWTSLSLLLAVLCGCSQQPTKLISFTNQAMIAASFEWDVARGFASEYTSKTNAEVIKVWCVAISAGQHWMDFTNFLAVKHPELSNEWTRLQ